MAIQTIQHAFEDEVFFTLRQQRNNWAKTAIAAICVAVLSLICLIIILPLNETQPFVVMVDRTTGEAEKIVQVRPATLEQQDAVLQAELVSYIVDRETYDPADNKRRIPDVMTRSLDEAATTLAATWSASSPQYPPELYGADTRVSVVVKSISVTPSKAKGAPDLARVRINKIREEKGRSKVQRSYIVTVGFDFKPNPEATLQSVWKNPLGFTVVSYRIDAEAAE